MTVIVGLTFFWIFGQEITVNVRATEVSYDVTPVIAHRYPANFRCNNGKYIDNRWFCDQVIQDCGDLSDETFGCNKEHCGSGKFACFSDDRCLNISNRCNTVKECIDGSDEFNCGDETNITNCDLHQGKYLCRDRLKCIDFEYTCDGFCNCFDCSDESSKCRKFDSKSCISCPHYCIPTPIGPQCACNSSNYKTSKLCQEIKDCTGDEFCSQYCTRYRNSRKCLCYEDHHEVYDADLGVIKCRINDWLHSVLLYSTAAKIKMVNITAKNHEETIRRVVNCTVLTAAKDYIYYSTQRDNKGTVFKTLISDKNAEKVIEFGSPIKSLSIDWISGNFYFTSNKSLLVCSNDGKICTLLKCCVVDDVAVASKFGWMFYIQNVTGDEYLIMKSNMDGSEENALLDKSWYNPISLAVDEWTETVYWLEMDIQMLTCVSMNGTNEREWYVGGGWEFSYPFAVAQEHSFFMKKRSFAIYIGNTSFNNFTARIDNGTNIIRHLFAYNPSLQFTHKIENPCANSPCKGLCLLRSATHTQNELNYTCVCKNFIPNNNNPFCVDHPIRSEPPSTSISKNHTPEPPSSERYLAIGIFSVVSCMAFAFFVPTFYSLIRNNNLCAKYCPTLDLAEQIEI